MFLKRIELTNWKNFRSSSADLSFRSFIIGPNASGKSNFLDSLRFMRDISLDGLQKSVEKRSGTSAIRCLSARKSPAIKIVSELAEKENEKIWRYVIEFNQDLRKRPLIRSEKVLNLRTNRIVLDRPNEADHADPERLTQTALEQISANREFREIAEFFRSTSYQHLVPQVVRDPKDFTATPVENDPYGRDLLIRIWNTPKSTTKARLTRISKVLQMAVPQLQSLDIDMDNFGTPHLVGRYEHWRAHDAKQNEAQFSDGTLRLFGLMWSMFEGAGPLLLEEPELSLHPEVVRIIPQLLTQIQKEIRKMKKQKKLGFRQLIISTHSDEMLRDLGISAEEVLRIEPSGEGSVILEASTEEKEALSSGFSVADILLPKAAPENIQMTFEF